MTSRSFGRGEEKGDKYQTAKIPLRPQMSPLSFMYPCVNPFVHLLLKGDSSSGYLRFLRNTGAGSRLEEFRPLRNYTVTLEPSPLGPLRTIFDTQKQACKKPLTRFLIVCTI
jgi:hypothetical protein